MQGYFFLSLLFDNIDHEVQRLTQAGIAFMSSVKTYEKTGKKLVYFRGPDGVLLELAEYPKAEE